MTHNRHTLTRHRRFCTFWCAIAFYKNTQLASSKNLTHLFPFICVDQVRLVNVFHKIISLEVSPNHDPQPSYHKRSLHCRVRCVSAALFVSVLSSLDQSCTMDWIYNAQDWDRIFRKLRRLDWIWFDWIELDWVDTRPLSCSGLRPTTVSRTIRRRWNDSASLEWTSTCATCTTCITVLPGLAMRYLHPKKRRATQRERKATKTLAIVLGTRNTQCFITMSAYNFNRFINIMLHFVHISFGFTFYSITWICGDCITSVFVFNIKFYCTLFFLNFLTYYFIIEANLFLNILFYFAIMQPYCWNAAREDKSPDKKFEKRKRDS